VSGLAISGRHLSAALELFALELGLSAVGIALYPHIRRRWRQSSLYMPLTPWRVAGICVATLMGVTYLLAVISVLAAVPTVLGLDSSVALVPGGRLYTYAAVLLSVALTAIALRYVYYYYCWSRSISSFRKPRGIDVTALSQRKLPLIKVQITTKGGALPVVQRGLRELEQSLQRHPWLARVLTAEVVTEEATAVGSGPAEARRVLHRALRRGDSRHRRPSARPRRLPVA
jgi:hypothetical protein